MPNAVNSKPILKTERLILRPWRKSDLEPFAALNADIRVTEFLGTGSLDQAASNAFANRIVVGFATYGYGLWAVEVPTVARFVGYVGLSLPDFEAHFTPAVEIGWRLAYEHWGKGYATEGARAVLDFAFARANLAEVVSYAASSNTRSRAVMERIGMTHDPYDDFNHPKLAPDHPLLRHVLYRFSATDWRKQQATKG